MLTLYTCLEYSVGIWEYQLDSITLQAGRSWLVVMLKLALEGDRLDLRLLTASVHNLCLHKQIYFKKERGIEEVRHIPTWSTCIFFSHGLVICIEAVFLYPAVPGYLISFRHPDVDLGRFGAGSCPFHKGSNTACMELFATVWHNQKKFCIQDYWKPIKPMLLLTIRCTVDA